jgi:HlyD family secretion protein
MEPAAPPPPARGGIILAAGAARPPLARVALAFQSDALEIEYRPLPRSARLTLYLLLALIVSAIGWASVSYVDRIVVAHGKLVTTAPTIVVQPMETSLIRTINVRPGDMVRQGDILATLDPTFTEADVGQLEYKLASLAAQIGRLEAELDERPYLLPEGTASADERLQGITYAKRHQQFEARLVAFDQQLAQAEAGIATKKADWQRLSARHAVAKEVESMRAELFQRDTGSKLNLLEARSARLQVERDMQLALSQIKESGEEIGRVQAERQAFIEEWRQKVAEELATLRREHNDVAKPLDKARKRSALVVLTSPVDAEVLEITERSVGSVLREAESFFTLVPLNVPLEAEVSIDAKDIGFVDAHAVAKIKLDAYPFQKHGTLEGVVRMISEDAFTERDKEKAQPPFYRSRIALASPELRAVPSTFRLIPGMTVSAEIKAGERTVLSYFLYPLLRGLDESIREP